MKQDDVHPPSWVLRTHFSRSVYHRSDICIDASWFSVPRKRLGSLSDSTLDRPKEPPAKDLVFIPSLPSLDVFCQVPVPSSEVEHHDESSVEADDFSFFSPSDTSCPSRVCRSPPSPCAEDTHSFPHLSPTSSPGKSGNTRMHANHSFQSRVRDRLSINLPRRSSSFNNLLRKQECAQSCPSMASPQPGGSSSKCSVWDSPQGSPVGTPNGSPNNSQANSPRHSRKLTNPLHASCASSGDHTKKASRRSPTKRDMTRALSWSDHLASPTGNERAVLSAENWMIDLSQLLLGERFAAGMYSRIYHGLYQDVPVAVKIIRRPDESKSLADRLEKVFMQEVTTLSCLQHQNVVKFIAACKKPPILCVITEYLPGGSLRAFLHKREGQLLPISQVLRMALDIASGMEYLHMKGFVHRDLKSENLVLGEDGCVKILDFGVSCFESDCNSDAHDLGTYRWMAPEMLSQKPYTRKVDVYSFGIVLWELLTAHVPYEEMGAVQAAFCVIHQNTRPPIPADCSAPLRDLMCHCWSTNSEDRPEFWEILRVLNMCMLDIPDSEGTGTL